MATVHWTLTGRRDYQAILGYYALNSPAYAAIFVTRVTGATQLLRRYPKIGRMVPEYQDETIRELIVGNYRLVYKLQARRVDLAAIVHGSQDLLRRLGSEAWNFP